MFAGLSIKYRFDFVIIARAGLISASVFPTLKQCRISLNIFPPGRLKTKRTTGGK